MTSSGPRLSRSAPTEEDDDEDDDEELPEGLPHVNPSDFLTPANPMTPDDLDPEERTEYETLSQPDRENYLGLRNHYVAMFEQPDDDSATIDREVQKLDREIEKEAPLEFETTTNKLKPGEVGFWAEDEDDELGRYEDADDDWDESMINAVAESELELHREIREYTRVAAWDMPLLSSMLHRTGINGY